MYKIGSLFSGIGGFELGLERAIPSETIWQVEQDKFCQSILKKHWPKAKIYNDVRNITKDNVEPVDILCGGFPCQDISVAGKTKGLKGEKSGLWWEMWRIISELRPRIIVLENVSNVLRLGGPEVLGSLAKIGYDAEWTTIRASDFGACHRRERWFCVAYPNGERCKKQFFTGPIEKKRQYTQSSSKDLYVTDSNSRSRTKQYTDTGGMEKIRKSTIQHRDFYFEKNWSDTRNYWQKNPPESPFCSVDDGIPQRVARLKALGNAIVPQCSQWIGEQIWKSGILQGGGHV